MLIESNWVRVMALAATLLAGCTTTPHRAPVEDRGPGAKSPVAAANAAASAPTDATKPLPGAENAGTQSVDTGGHERNESPRCVGGGFSNGPAATAEDAPVDVEVLRFGRRLTDGADDRWRARRSGRSRLGDHAVELQLITSGLRSLIKHGISW